MTDKTNAERQERSRNKKKDAGVKDIRIPLDKSLRERFISVPGENHAERIEYLLNKAKL